MHNSHETRTSSQTRLDQISTQWTIVNDPGQFVARYAPAIRKYLSALIRNEHDAEEVAQDFLLHTMECGFARVCSEGGRFRDYLKAAVRNAAFSFLRRKHPVTQGLGHVEQLPVQDDAQAAADQNWLAEWRKCILERGWRALKQHQRNSPGNLCYTVLRLAAQYPGENSRSLAARATSLSGQSLTPEAYRKQVSRARALLAKLLIEQVAETLDLPTPDHVREELVAIGLMKYLRSFLAAERGS